jgi:hypothetical protein
MDACDVDQMHGIQISRKHELLIGRIERKRNLLTYERTAVLNLN